jgi:hypothetical protein
LLVFCILASIYILSRTTIGDLDYRLRLAVREVSKDGEFKFIFRSEFKRSGKYKWSIAWLEKETDLLGDRES